MSLDALKREACGAIDALREELVAASHAIHAKPELAFEERFASDLLAKAVGRHDLPVDRGAYKVATAYASEFGPAGAPVMRILSEYDALPGIGHARADTISLRRRALARRLGSRSSGRNSRAASAIWERRLRNAAAARK